ncbi:MAG TPA: DUF192 domain-containing protein [Polyangiaceae bacterium]|nr:DUF192 domain-containing protein [Polyangiaceae bacterium]
MPRRRPRSGLAFGLFGPFALLLVAHCDRAPAEPAAEAPRHVAPSRCMRATPEAPPAPVSPGPDPRCPRDPSAPPKVPAGRVSFPQAPGAPSVDVEVMASEELRSRGLMYRRELAENRGMLFAFDEESPRAFWMRNTCLPLDMVFVAADGFVVGVLENVPTMNDDPREVRCAAKYVLEVNAGYCRRHGIKAGQSMAIETTAL